MAGINKVILIGNLGKDPEIKYLENGSVVANVRIATTEYFRNKEGERSESTEWHDLEMWDSLAKIADEYLKKGHCIYVEGKLKTDSWQDENGNTRKKTKIRVKTMTMLEKNHTNQNAESSNIFFDKSDETTDELPF